MGNFENFFNYCGLMNEQLLKAYKKSKEKKQGITFPQYCVIHFATMLDKLKTLNIQS